MIVFDGNFQLQFIHCTSFILSQARRSPSSFNYAKTPGNALNFIFWCQKETIYRPSEIGKTRLQNFETLLKLLTAMWDWSKALLYFTTTGTCTSDRGVLEIQGFSGRSAGHPAGWPAARPAGRPAGRPVGRPAERLDWLGLGKAEHLLCPHLVWGYPKLSDILPNPNTFTSMGSAVLILCILIG